jgi:LmbE family N-acetylglucosaminyl deacetylase
MRLLRRPALALHRQFIRRRSRRWSDEELRRSAVVFSPHFDDETLGCGGTIVQKRRAGAAVAVVFMTDGSASHRHLLSETELRRTRADEGIAAAAAMGMSSGDVELLAYPETKLCEHEADAVEKVLQILRRRSPQEVYVPYRREPLIWSKDHRATTSIVKSALEQWGRRVTVHEYPIWFYRQWPWTTWAASGWERRTFVKLAMTSPLGLGVTCGLRDRRDVGDALEEKRAALGRHGSQMSRLIDDASWKTLGDIAGGSFLDCFFAEFELFHSYEFAGKTVPAALTPAAALAPGK